MIQECMECNDVGMITETKGLIGGEHYTEILDQCPYSITFQVWTFLQKMLFSRRAMTQKTLSKGLKSRFLLIKPM